MIVINTSVLRHVSQYLKLIYSKVRPIIKTINRSQKMKKLLLICSITTVITGCANEPLIKETQSGKAEAEYPNYTQEQVVDAIQQETSFKER